MKNLIVITLFVLLFTPHSLAINGWETGPLADNKVISDCAMSNGYIAWTDGVGENPINLYIWNENSFLEINDIGYCVPSFSGIMLAFLGNDDEIYVYNVTTGDPNTITRVTDTGTEKQRLCFSGDTIFWHDEHSADLFYTKMICPNQLSKDFNEDCIVDFFDYTLFTQVEITFSQLADFASEWLNDGS